MFSIYFVLGEINTAVLAYFHLMTKPPFLLFWAISIAPASLR